MSKSKEPNRLTAGSLAPKAGVSTDTLRHYEAKGVIQRPPRQANGYRSQHLGHIAKMFEHGNFQIPMFVHGKMPDGAKVMQQQKANITYKYEETRNGGLVRIRTRNPEALKAVHEFLRFQIEEHQTGDSTS